MSVNENQGQFLPLFCSKYCINITGHKAININCLINYFFYFSETFIYLVTYMAFSIISWQLDSFTWFPGPYLSHCIQRLSVTLSGTGPPSFKVTQGRSGALFFTSNSPLCICHYYFAIARPNNCVIFHLCFIITKSIFCRLFPWFQKDKSEMIKMGQSNTIFLSIYFWNLIVFLNCAKTLIF